MRKMNIGLNYELQRHGQGSIGVFGYDEGFVDEGSGVAGKTKKKFLQGINETKNIITAQFQWETFRQQYFYLTYQYAHIDGFENIRDRSVVQNRLLIGYKLDY
jgi:hypothetical protein